MSSYFVLKIQYVNRPPETRNISAATTSIGRESGDIVLNDPQTSGRHAEILFQSGQVRCRDVGSTNGTWFNGQRLMEFVLEPGQWFQAGQTTLQLMAVHGEQPAPARTVMAMGAPPPAAGPGGQPQGWGPPPGARPPAGPPPGPPGFPQAQAPAPYGAPGGPPPGPPQGAPPWGPPPGPPPGGPVGARPGMPPGPPMGGPPMGGPPMGGPPMGGPMGGPPMGGPPMGGPPMGGPPMGPPQGGPPPYGPPQGGPHQGAPHPQYGGPPGPPQGGPQPPYGPPQGGPPPYGPPQGGPQPPYGPPQGGPQPPYGPPQGGPPMGGPMGGPPMGGPPMGGPPMGPPMGGPPMGGPMARPGGPPMGGPPMGGPGFGGPPMPMGAQFTPAPMGMAAGGGMRPNFQGTGGELFVTFLVGMLLCLITLNIYLSWFYCKLTNFVLSNTTLGPTRRGELRLEFTGKGGELFVTMLVGGLLTFITFFIYTPWFICKLIKFFTNNVTATAQDGTRYRLNFEGTGGELFVTFLVGGLLSAITFYIYLPWFICKVRKVLYQRTAILENEQPVGNLDFEGRGGELLVIGLVGFLLMIVTIGIYRFWLTVKLNKFYAENTRINYQGRTFAGAFHGTGGEYFVTVLIGALLCAVTLYIYFPWFLIKLWKFDMNNLEFSEMGGGQGGMQAFPPNQMMPAMR